MNWLRRIWNIWRLRRTTFFYCIDCSLPLLTEEIDEAHFCKDLPRCEDCREIAKIRALDLQKKYPLGIVPIGQVASEADWSALQNQNPYLSQLQLQGLQNQRTGIENTLQGLGGQLGNLGRGGLINGAFSQLMRPGLRQDFGLDDYTIQRAKTDSEFRNELNNKLQAELREKVLEEQVRQQQTKFPQDAKMWLNDMLIYPPKKNDPPN